MILISKLFSILSSLSFVPVPFFYFRQMIKGKSTPNPATWLVTLVVLSLNAITFFSVVNRNLWKMLLPGFILFSVIITVAYALIAGKFAKIGKVEIISLVLAGIIVVVWRTSYDDVTANLALQPVLMIAFLATIIGLIRRTMKEWWVSWGIAAFSYILMITSLLLALKSWVELVYPIINGVLGNGVVAAIAYVKNKRN